MSSNGKDQIKITVTDIDENYAVFQVGEHPPGVDATRALSQCLIDWYHERGPAIIWASTSIVRDGNTVAVHVWYE